MMTSVPTPMALFPEPATDADKAALESSGWSRPAPVVTDVENQPVNEPDFTFHFAMPAATGRRICSAGRGSKETVEITCRGGGMKISCDGTVSSPRLSGEIDLPEPPLVAMVLASDVRAFLKSVDRWKWKKLCVEWFVDQAMVRLSSPTTALDPGQSKDIWPIDGRVRLTEDDVETELITAHTSLTQLCDGLENKRALASDRLKDLESAIDRGLKTFYQVAQPFARSATTTYIAHPAFSGSQTTASNDGAGPSVTRNII